jgi:hypothetical protein
VPDAKILLRSVLQLSLPVCVFLYCVGFHYAYVNWVSPVWAYEGMTYTSPNLVLLALSYGLAMLMALVAPPHILKPSHAIFWVLFFMVYVPGIFVPLFIQLETGILLLALQLCLTSGMLILALLSRIPTLNLRRYPLKPEFFWGGFFVLYLIAYATMIAVYHGNMQFASMETMYSIRHDAGKVLQKNPATGYVSQMLANVMNPLLLAYGFERKKKRFWVLGMLGQITIFSIFANKLALLSPFVIATFFYTIRRDRGAWVPKANLALAGMFFCLTTMVIGVSAGPIFNIATVAIVRNFAIPGMLTGDYQYVFENRPHTYLSNVAGFSKIVSSDYTMPVGFEVSSFFGAKDNSERGMANSNANFFATDGIAAFGLWGIPLSAVLCAFVLWVLDGVTKSYSIEFAVAAMTMVIYSLTNISIFTTLLGNGMFAWMLLFVLMPCSVSDFVPVNSGVRNKVNRAVLHREASGNLGGLH